jgi:uncharacterized protein (TIGR02118 family)
LFEEVAVIKVSVIYPYKNGARFDMGYYLDSHIPMVRQRLGAACKGIAVDQGAVGVAPEGSPAFAVMAHLLFESVPVFQAAFAPHAQAIMADIPNYTPIEPVVQISDVKLS